MVQQKSVLKLLSYTFLFAALFVARADAQITLACTFPATAQVGVSYTGASCTAGGGQSPYLYSSPTLPAGLSIDSGSGVVSGKPTSAGTTSFTVNVSDSTTPTPLATSQTINNFVVAPAALTLACTFPATAQVGVAYTGASCTAAGGTLPYSYSSSTLPAGLTINSSTGAVSGKPTSPGTTSFTVNVSDGATPTPQTASQSISNFVVAPAALTLTCTFPATAQVGVAYTGASCTAGGGATPYTYASPTLPAGLTINSSTGAVSGKPTSAGTTSFSVNVSDSTTPTPKTASQTINNFVVAPAALTLTCTFPATAQVGLAYTGANCTASGGATPYAYASPTLPAGLTINASTGVVSGKPTSAGTTSFTVNVSDATTPTPQTASQSINNFVVAPAALSLACTFPATAQVGVAYTGASCTATGGATPYTYASPTLPAGLTINASTGVVSGKPTSAGTTSFTVNVTDSTTPTAQTASQSINNFVVAPAGLSLTCTFPATAQVGVAYTGASCTAAGGTTPYTYASPTLPAGLTINASTGVVSGKPTSAGTTSFTVNVTDSTTPTAQTASQSINNFVVTPAGLSLTCTFPATAQVGVAYTGASCTAAGGTTPYTYASPTLPAGLTINASTGVVSGKPTSAGTTSFTVNVTDSTTPTAQTASQSISNFVVAPAALTLACTFPATAQVGVAYTGASCTAAGGKLPYTYASPTLPAGLTINASTGVVSGKPTSAGTTSFTVNVTDSTTPTAETASQSISNFVVAPAGLSLTCTFPATAQVGVAYTGASCAAAGGTTPYVYSSPALPAGLTINSSTGVVSGKPTNAGTTSFTVNVTDNTTPTAQTASQPINNFIVAPAALSLTCTFPATAQVGVAYTGASCTASGGTAPYTYASPTLPAGLTINSSTGVVSGKPTTAGTTSFTVNVTDSTTPTGQTASQSINNFVVAPPTLTLTCTLPSAQAGVAYTTGSCSASGGTLPYSYSVSPSPFASGLTINSSTGAASGTPATAGTYSFTVKVTDGSSQTATQAFTTFVVAPSTLTLNCTFPAGAQVGVAYTGASCSAAGGTTPYSYSSSSLPPGLNINSSTGAVSGSPTNAGTFTIIVKVTDSSSSTQTATQTISNYVVAPATLTLSCTVPAHGIVGVAYTANCNAGGGTTPYSYSVSTGTLPGGLTLNTSTGAITGTLNTANTYNFSIKATDAGNPAQTATQPFTVTVVPTLSIPTTSFASGIVGISYSASCSANGGTTPYAFSISGGALPTGLGINSSNCAITGTPTANGTFNFSIKVTDGGTPQQSYTQPLSITINSALVITSTSAPNGSVNVAYAFALTAQNGTGPYNWSLTGGSLPPGLNLSGSVISGIPTTVGSYSFTIKVTDSGSPVQTQTQAFSNVSIAAGLTITTTSLSSGVVGSAYSATIVAQNGQVPYTWSISSGALPGGLTLGSGTITGTPTAAGTFNFTVKVVDSTTPTAQVATQPLSITIASTLTLSSAALPNGVVAVAYGSGCSASGGTSPNTFSLAAGTLPAGLSLNASNCTISGTPTTPGTSSFTIKVTDASNPAQSKSQAFSITIGSGLVISSGSVPNGYTGQPYSTTLTATNGVAPYTWSRTGGALPPGLTLGSSGTISGTPTTVGNYSFTVTVTDNGGSLQQTATATFSNVSIAAGLTITTTSLSAAAQSTAYTANLTAANAVGALTWTWAAAGGSSLPAGLTLNSSTGTISGTPTSPGTFSFTVSVKDGTTNQTASQPLSLTVASALTLSTAALPNGAPGVAYVASCSASGGAPPYSFSLATGTLPTGLSLNASNCTISGTPTVSATSNFTLKVTDSGNPVQNKSQAYSITVATGLAITTNSVPNGFTGQPYSVALGATNGVPPYAWIVSGGALPPGLGLSSSGTISGTPTTVGNGYSFTVKVTDSGKPVQTATATFSNVSIAGGLTITTPALLPTAFQSFPYGPITLSASGGAGPFTWSASSLPAGLTLDPSAGTLSGTPSTPGTSSFTVTVKDASTSEVASQSFTLSVNPYSACAAPAFTFNGLPTTQTPGVAIAASTITANPVACPWPLTITLGFKPNAAGVSAGYMDPALQFVDGSGTPQGTSYGATLVSSTISLPQIGPGTVEGQVSVTITPLGQTGTTSSFNVPASIPIITPGGVQVLNVTSTGFDVEVIANSSPRDLKTATFTFSATSGNSISGTTTFTVDVTSLMSGWYAGTSSQQYGSQFALTVPFTFSGNSSAISSVSVTLTNSVGTSTALSGTI